MAIEEFICTCKVCLLPFPAPNRRPWYCSSDCAAKAKAAYVRPPRPTIAIVCQFCSASITRTKQRYDFAKYCSRTCAYSGRAITRAAQAAKDELVRQEAHRAEVELRKSERIAKSAELRAERALLRKETPTDCKVCGDRFLRAVGEEKICSDVCKTEYLEERKRVKDSAPSRLKAKRIYRAKRRLQEEGGENIDPLEVFERDQWRCYICSTPTPRYLRGTYAPNAPELEHVVSLTSGGRHAWDNVACACRSCNGEKGAKSLRCYVVNQDGPQIDLGDSKFILQMLEP